VRKLRHKLGVRPVFKRIDTCAAEFEAKTPYMYSTYEAPSFGEPENEASRPIARRSSSSAAGRTGSGRGSSSIIAAATPASRWRCAGYETIMVNCNPETVSTDYDTSDRLYFEPLTAEDVLEILHVEQQNGTLVGVIVQFGGQTPLNLAQGAGTAGIPILGTSPTRSTWPRTASASPRWSRSSACKQPANGIARSRDEAIAVAERIGYPVLMRPSYVLGGRAMEIVDGPSSSTIISRPRCRCRAIARADRPVSARRDRGRCRCDLRRHDVVGRRRAPAYRGSRRPFGRQRLLDPALQPVRRDHRRDRAPDRCAGPALKVKG
jgi:carbamoyl-phosphate synthase large subunit